MSHQPNQCDCCSVGGDDRRTLAGLGGIAQDPGVLSGVLGALTAHLALLDDTGCIVLTNDAWASFATGNGETRCATSLGLNYLQTCERAFDDPLTGVEARSMAGAIRAALDGRREPTVVEYPCDSPTEKRWFEATVRRVEVGGRVFVAVTHQNVTALRTIIEQLKVARVAAEAADRAKSEFLTNVSHEIRTPMTAILGYADLLAERGDRSKAPKDRLDALVTIQRNGRQLVALINDILDLSKIESGQIEIGRSLVDVRQALRDVIDTLAPAAQSQGLTLELHAGTQLPSRLWTDPVRLRQILMAIGGNAVKFTHQGQVRIQVDALQAPGIAPRLRFAVHDTGIGMSPEQMSALFVAFQQGDGSMSRRYGGVGLGLRIAGGLAHAMGCRLEVSSQPGRGSVFSLNMPADGAEWTAPITTGPIETAHAPDTQVGGALDRLDGLRVFVVEDGIDNQRLLCLLLRKAGAIVTTLDNGALAWAALAPDGRLIDPPPCDLIISDMQMPEMDGYELARTLRAAGWKGPIVALTAHGMVGDEQKCLDAGCDAYATKPIDRARLIDLCGRWARKGGQRPEDETLHRKAA